MNEPKVEKLFYRVIIPSIPTTTVLLPFLGRLTISNGI